MTNFISKIKKRYILLVILALFFIPFPTELIPEWKMQFVDEQNQPLSNVNAEQSWRNYTFIAVDGFDEKCTDKNGVVIFPKRLLWASAFSRLVSPIIAGIMTLAHGSTGTSAYVRVFDRNYISDYQYWREKENLYIYERSKLPDKAIAKSSDVINGKICGN